MADPFIGVDVGAQTTVFYRQGPGGIEGFVVDNAQLVSTLKQRVLEERGLSEVLSVSQSRGGEAFSQLSHSYTHQFAEPFGAVSANLRLGPIETPFGEQWLLPLSCLVVLMLLLVLYAVFRIVKSQLELAVRQNNFVSAVSHELKTPLTAIRMHGEMLEDGLIPDGAKIQESYRTIVGQTERLSRLIDNVLWISNVERKVRDVRKLDICAAVERAVQTLAPQAEKSGASLVVDVPKTSVQALAEPDALEQILFNLVDNALKYAASAEDRRITIGVEQKDGHPSIYVRDRGPGIAEGQLKKIFEPFYRAGDEMTRRAQGTGLGLSLVRDLTHSMGAEIQAHNASPGAVFMVEFQAPQSDHQR